jgi:hypothetical protein
VIYHSGLKGAGNRTLKIYLLSLLQNAAAGFSLGFDRLEGLGLTRVFYKLDNTPLTSK